MIVKSDSEEEEGMEDDDLDNDVDMEHIVTSDEARDATGCLESFIEQSGLPDECSRDINRLERSIFRHRMTSMTKGKTSTPSIKSFFKLF